MSVDGAVGLCLFKMSPRLYLDREGSGLKSSVGSVCSQIKSKTRGASVGEKERLFRSETGNLGRRQTHGQRPIPLSSPPHISLGPELSEGSFLGV